MRVCFKNVKLCSEVRLGVEKIFILFIFFGTLPSIKHLKLIRLLTIIF